MYIGPVRGSCGPRTLNTRETFARDGVGPRPKLKWLHRDPAVIPDITERLTDRHEIRWPRSGMATTLVIRLDVRHIVSDAAKIQVIDTK